MCIDVATKASQALSEGQILLDQLLLPVKDAKGQDVTPADRKQQVALVDETVGDVQQRRGRCDELSDVRRLKLRQLLQLRTCERDVDQVRHSLSVCLSVTLVHPTQPVEIFGNFSSPFGTLAIR